MLKEFAIGNRIVLVIAGVLKPGDAITCKHKILGVNLLINKTDYFLTRLPFKCGLFTNQICTQKPEPALRLGSPFMSVHF